MGMGSFRGEGLSKLERDVEALKMARSHHYVSFGDVMKHKLFKDLKLKPKGTFPHPNEVPRIVLEAILREYGLDISMPYGLEYNTHRMYNGEITERPMHRWEGWMRSDKKWVDYIYRNTGIRLFEKRRKKNDNH